jgi:MFS family permease
VSTRLARTDPALAAIVAEGFFSRLSFGLISFGLPLYAYQRFGLSLTEVGVLASLNLAVAIALKPLMGSLADRFGVRPSFLAAIGLRSVVSLLLALAAVPWHLYAIRGAHGLSIALRDPSANVLLADLGGKKAVASAFAWYQTAKSVAGAIGKASAGILLTLTASNFSLLFLIAFALSAVPVLVVARYVRPRDAHAEHGRAAPTKSLREAELEPSTEAPTPQRPPVGETAPAVLPFAGLGFLISGTAYMLANLFPIFAVEYAGLSEAETGLIYTLSIVVVLTGPVFGWLSDHVSQKLVLSVRSAANVVSSVIYLVAPSFAGMALGRAVDDAGKAAFRPAWGALMAHVAGFDRRRRARTMGSLSAGEDAGEVAGPILAGFLWSTWGVPALLGVRIALAAVTEIYSLFLVRSLRQLAEDGRESPRELLPGPGLLVLDAVCLDGNSAPVTGVVAPGQVAVHVSDEPGSIAQLRAILAGERAPAGGSVLVDGQDLRRCSPASVRRVVSDLVLAAPPADAVVRDVLACRWPEAPPEELTRVWALADLDASVGPLSANVDRTVGEFDSVDRCRLALAASLVGDPAVLMLDESLVPPSAALSSTLERVLARHLGTVVVVNATNERLGLADVVVAATAPSARALAYS